MKMNPQQKYAVIHYDGNDGHLRFDGIAIGAVLINTHKKNIYSRNNDGMFELDEEGNMYAIPCDGKPYQPEEGT